ncbi:MAG: hypothetical protein AB1941_28965 [Gemmatimonadota bacterium]
MTSRAPRAAPRRAPERPVRSRRAQPRRTSLAWAGAHPRFSPVEQLGLWQPAAGGDDDEPCTRSFDPRDWTVRRLASSGCADSVEDFAARWHYTQSGGMPGPAWGLYHSPTATLGGVCAFARLPNPRWAAIAFPDPPRATGAGDQHPVAESEYLNLSRLVLADPGQARLPLGKRAASWFVARCFHVVAERNRALWIAETARAAGLPLTPAQRLLLADAKLARSRHGWGFTKACVAYADPHHGHDGRVYRALGFHHAGMSPDAGAERSPVGLRTGERLSRRTVQKARGTPSTKGQATAALRLACEGAPCTVEVRLAGTVVETDDGSWLHACSGTGAALRQSIAAAWRRRRLQAAARWGAEAAVHVRVAPGGIEYRTFPPRHRYVTLLGAPWYRHGLALRCTWLRERMLDVDSRWRARGFGPRPDERALWYPAP